MLTASGVVSVDGIILFPEEWQGNIDQNTIVVQLTPIGTAQELYVDRIEWGTKAIIRNGGGGALKAYYTVTVQELAPAPVPTKEKSAMMSRSKARSK